MGVAEKIAFPYGLTTLENSSRTAIFFGTDFYNLPADSNQGRFIEETNNMLSYMRRHFPDCDLVYQPHPNEKDEFTKLDLTGFTVGEKIIAEVLLYENAQNIKFVLSACSGASISAYAMGINAGIFIDRLHGAISEEAIIGYRNYFAGASEDFFISSYDMQPPMRAKHLKSADTYAISRIQEAISKTKRLWILTSSPALSIQASLVLRFASEHNPGMTAGLLKIGDKRWETMPKITDLESGFDETIYLRNKRIINSARPKRLWEAIVTALKIRTLPIQKGDVVVSFCNTLFEENCILAYHGRKARMVSFIENRWHHFTFQDKGRSLAAQHFREPWGALVFAWFLEPMLGLYRTITLEFQDGRVINFFRYRKPLERVYDHAFIVMPDSSQSGVIRTMPYTRIHA